MNSTSDVGLLERRVHLVTGKGGVGRTAISAALARAAARHGKRVLLAEVGDPEGGHSAIGHRFGIERLSSTPEELEPGVLGCHLWATSGHEYFFQRILPGALVRTALRSKGLGRFLMAAPAFHEMGLFYHLLTLLEAEEPDGAPTHEVLIVDMPATGHALALTSLPKTLLRIAPSGPVASAVRRGLAFVTDPGKSSAWVVTLPEQLPVTEALELIEGLDGTDMPIGGVILNRFPNNPFEPDEQAALEEWLARTSVHGELTVKKLIQSREAAKRLEAALSVPLWVFPEHSETGGALDEALAENAFRELERAR